MYTESVTLWVTGFELVTLWFSHSLCQSLLVSVPPCVSHSLCQSLHVSVTPCVCHSLCQSFLVSVTPCVRHSLCQLLLVSVTPCVSHSLCQSLPVSVSLRSGYVQTNSGRCMLPQPRVCCEHNEANLSWDVIWTRQRVDLCIILCHCFIIQRTRSKSANEFKVCRKPAE